MKKFVSIKTKIVFWMIPVLVLLFLFVSTFFMRFSSKIIKREYTKSMEFTMVNISNVLEFPLWANNREEIENILSELIKKPAVKKIVIEFGNDPEYYIYESPIKIKNDTLFEISVSISREKEMQDIMLFSDTGKENFVRVFLSEKEIDNEMSESLRLFNMFLLLITFILFVLAYFFVDSLTTPILKLSSQVEEMSKLNFNRKIEMDANDEIGVLANRFENMRKEIVDYSKRLENWNRNLEEQVDLKTDELNSKNQELMSAIDKLEDLNFNYKNVNEVLNQTLKELSVAKDKAEESSRLKSQFVSMISHELRTPLTSIIGYTQLLQTGILGKLDEKMVDSLNAIEASAKDLLFLINDIIDISKIDLSKFSLSFKKVKLNDFFATIKTEIQPLIDKRGLDFIEIYNYHDQEGYFDELRIKQVIINLFSNAIKFTEKGHIKIEVLQTNTIKLNTKGAASGEFLQVAVEDTGFGIKKDEVEKIWDLFYQTDDKLTRKVGGTGLGLTISRQIVSLHKGRFFLNTEFRKGSTFTFIIPLNQEEINSKH